MPHKTLLILGGTGEAAELARQVVARFGARLRVIVSYAGVTGHQPDLPCEKHIGGFGGASGLISFMETEGVDYLVDASHPYAEKISQHAYVATQALGCPVVVLMRLPWIETPKDRWLQVPDMDAAAAMVNDLKRKTFLTIGVKELSKFSDLHDVPLLVRMLKEPENGLELENYEVVCGHPPFSVEDERKLMRDKKIKLLVTKNSGGEKTQAKIIAAREEKIGVIMVERPASEPLDHVASFGEILEWLAVHNA